jgi:hypothetical protein
LFSRQDFQQLLSSLDGMLTINIQRDETPTAAMKRQNVDKVLLARRFAENVTAKAMNLTEETRQRVAALLNRILQALPVRAVSVNVANH